MSARAARSIVGVLLGSLACAGLPVPETSAPLPPPVAQPEPEIPPGDPSEGRLGAWLAPASEDGCCETLLAVFPGGRVWIDVRRPGATGDSAIYRAVSVSPDQIDIPCPLDEGCLDGSGKRSIPKGGTLASLKGSAPDLDILWGSGFSAPKTPLARWQGGSEEICCCLAHEDQIDTFSYLLARAETCGAHCLPAQAVRRCDPPPPSPW